jgi:Lon protease-like protein
MNNSTFNRLSSQDKVSYIYQNCKLIDFEIVQEKHREFGVCLYHDGQIFVEVCFDGMRGEQVKEIKAFGCLSELSHWYDRIDLGTLLSQSI